MKAFPILAIAAGVMTCGCDTVRSTFGLDHYQPDEFNVSADNPPLSMPPDYRLRPPKTNGGAKACAADNDACRKAQGILGVTPAKPAPGKKNDQAQEKS